MWIASRNEQDLPGSIIAPTAVVICAHPITPSLPVQNETIPDVAERE
jgi:hypothetical protein